MFPGVSNVLTRAGTAKACLVDLPQPASHGNRIVFSHHAFVLNREDPVQVAPASATKGSAFLLRRHAELRVKLSDVMLPKKAIGCLYCADSRQPKLLRQTSLPGSETTLRASTRLGRIGRNHLDRKSTRLNSSHLG